jgi:catechol 2,3-dioxygenase-like lactoylglutathione lyase family enzyme
MVRAIDHIVIAVRDLAEASADYARAGFTVTPGGEHTGGATHNALVSFGDGAYFELIAFREPDREQDHKWWAKFRNGEGTVDYALLADDLNAEAARLREAGMTIDGPVDGGRQRPDGERLAWRNASLERGDVPLPFVIEDITPRDLRVPPGAATEHPLGVSGVAGLVILVPDLDRAANAYSALLGASGEAAASDIPGARRALRFPLGAQWIELVEPEAGAAELQRQIRDRGAAPYEIVLMGNTARPSLPLDAMHGARIRIT